MFKHFSACSETWNCNNSVCQDFFWLSKPLCYQKKERPKKKRRKGKKKKKKPSTRNTSCSSLARELNLATCSTWQWISQRASDSSCRPLTAARKSLSGLLLTEAQQLSEMFKGTIIQGLSSRPPHVRAEENLLRASRLWEGVCKLISESPNLGWLFYLSADLVLQPPEPSISCRR